MPVYNVKLEANATYGVRTATLARVSSPGEPLTGVIEVREQVSPDDKVRTRRYAVKELPADQGRRFRLRKPLTDGSEDRYVSLPIDGWPACTCEAGQARGWCTHLEAIVRLADHGFLDSCLASPASGM